MLQRAWPARHDNQLGKFVIDGRACAGKKPEEDTGVTLAGRRRSARADL